MHLRGSRVRHRAAVAATAVLGLVLAVDVPVAGEVRPTPPVVDRTGSDRRPAIVVAVATTRPVVALTFDDGPDPRWTPPILAELRRTGARATFFVTGAQARAHPDLLHEIVASGSEIANHTDTHPPMDGLASAAVVAQVRAASFAIGAAGVDQVPYFRPPRGRYGREALVGVSESGLLTVGWTVCLERWLRQAGPVDGPAEAAASVRSGGVLLAHDGGIPDRSATVRAVPALLDSLAARGYEVVTVSELLAVGPHLQARPGKDPRDAPLTRVGLRSPT